MIAPPRMTFATQGAPADIRNAYLKAINASLSGCEPFKFTAGLGDAIAGRPIMIRYVDNRDLEKQSGAGELKRAVSRTSPRCPSKM
jgi:hypothetical protein